MSVVLVTGGTGFIGRSLIPQLIAAGHHVRTLIRPSQQTPNLPKGIPVEAIVAGLNDERGLRAAMVGVDTVIHLAGAEWKGAYASLLEIDIEGTRTISRVAAEANIDRLLYVSHLGADRASAFPVMKAKAIAEEYIRRSGIDYTIFRTAVVFGPNDGFTTGLGFVMKIVPFLFLMPGDGQALLQPIWIDDLVTCMTWALEDSGTRNQLYEIGGGEYLTMNQIVGIFNETLGINRAIIHVSQPYLRGLTVFLESIFPGFPISVFWLDYLAANRTCSLDTLPRVFHLMPARFSTSMLTYLHEVNWRKIILQNFRFRRVRTP
jgi:uncharacterized protein YbjT (DUF2867 family)